MTVRIFSVVAKDFDQIKQVGHTVILWSAATNKYARMRAVDTVAANMLACEHLRRQPINIGRPVGV